MDCIPKVLLKRRNLRQHFRRVDPGINSGYCDLLGESPIAVNSNDLHVSADMSIARAAEIADVADDVTLGGNKVANLDGCDVSPYFHYIPAQLVTDDDRRFDPVSRPRVPIVDVEIGSTNGCGAGLDEDIARSNPWDRNNAIFEPRSWFGLDDRPHHFWHQFIIP